MNSDRTLLHEFSRTLDAIDRGIAAHWHLGGQVCVRHRGEVVLNVARGQNVVGSALTTPHLMNWFSSGKPITAIAIALLWERGRLDLDDPVVRFIPQFAPHGKERVTIRHLLTHTAGFRLVDTGWPIASWSEIIEALCKCKIEPRWEPGKKAGYHALTSWFVLGEIIHRIDGRMPDTFVRDEIFEPLNMHESWMSLTPEQVERDRDRIGVMHETSEASDTVPPTTLDWHETPKVTSLSPGSTCRGPASELARFYQMLLNKGQLDGRRLLMPQTVEALTTRHRVGMFDHTFRFPMEWGLGFIVQSEREGTGHAPYGFGPGVSQRTFGHSGQQSSTALADPERDLIMVAIFNGLCGNARHDERAKALITAVLDDLTDLPG